MVPQTPRSGRGRAGKCCSALRLCDLDHGLASFSKQQERLPGPPSEEFLFYRPSSRGDRHCDSVLFSEEPEAQRRDVTLEFTQLHGGGA